MELYLYVRTELFVVSMSAPIYYIIYKVTDESKTTLFTTTIIIVELLILQFQLQSCFFIIVRSQ